MIELKMIIYNVTAWALPAHRIKSTYYELKVITEYTLGRSQIY